MNLKHPKHLKMDKQHKILACWLVLLLAFVFGWLYYDIKSMSVDYDRHKYLVDSKTGEKRKPYDLYNLTKIINQTEEYIESTNAIERLYDLEYNLNFENPFQIDQTYSRQRESQVSGWPVANQLKCGHQLDWILGQLDRHGKNLTLLRGRLGLELTRLIDTFGKPDAGVYSGLVTWLGSYEQCQQLSLDRGNIKTRYCFARMRPMWWPKNESAASETIIRIGSCLPETCDTNSFDLHRAQLEKLIKFDLSEFWRQGLEFESLFCLPDERSPIRWIPLSGWVYIYAVSIWLAVVLTGSIIHELATREQKKDELAKTTKVTTVGAQVAQALSIRCAFKAFKTNRFRVRYAQGERVRVDLGMLDMVKILMAIGVVLGHSGYLWMIYTRTMGNRLSNATGGLGRMGLSVSRCVDTFFFFFGLLTAHTMLRKFSRAQLASPLTWLLVNLGVFFRITPLFMLVFWYSKSISPYTGSGPWWDYGVHQYSQKGACMRDPWWRSLPYFGCSTGVPAPACILPGWFIVSYSQLSLLLPLLIYILAGLVSNRQRFGLVTLLSLVSVAQLAFKLNIQTSIKLEHFSSLGSFAADLMEKFESIGFMSTLGKLGSVSMGCLVGYLLYRYGNGDILEWPRWVRSKVLFVLVIILHVVLVFVPVIASQITHLTQRNQTTLAEFIVSNAVLQLIWPMLNAILVINCTTIYNGHYLCRWAGHSFWRAFNKLGLCLYLVHWEVIFVGLTNYEQAPSHGFMTDVMKMWAFGVFFSLILALLLHILFEAPLAALTLLLFSRVLSSSSAPAPSPKITSGNQTRIELPLGVQHDESKRTARSKSIPA